MRISHTVLLIAGLVLTGCSQGSVKENLGLTRKAPDEFRVVSRPPLSVPKEFFLVPPSHGGAAEGVDTTAQARALVTGDKAAASEPLADTAAPVVSTSPLATAAEESLLKRAGGGAADPTIREKLYKEQAKTAEDEPNMLDRLRGKGEGDPVVDAKAERKRLESNKQAKKPVNEGKVPVVDPKGKSTLDRLF